MRILFIPALVVLTAVLLSGCSTNVNDYSLTHSDDGFKVKTQKDSNKISGRLTKEGNNYYLIADDGQKTRLRTYTINLESHLNRHITLVGEYSGDIFDIKEIE